MVKHKSAENYVGRPKEESLVKYKSADNYFGWPNNKEPSIDDAVCYQIGSQPN